MSVEILAPAGSGESVLAAVRCGADAVYVGGERFSARAGAENFTRDELEKAADYCHLHNVKIYQAINTLFFDNELDDVLNEVKFASDIGIDALIVQDLGAAYAIKQTFPDMRLNASTQMTIHTPQGAEAAAELGFSRVVVARELSLGQIKRICGCGPEVEAFVHGAQCMSVSGQCAMSAVIGSRSANRGMCAQACRLPFSAIKGVERHDLSLKDMCAIRHIAELEEAGVRSLKIEGRMKRAEYVAAAVSACRAAADGKEPDLDTLEAVFSRSGFTDGYITGKTGAAMFGIRRKEDVVSAESVLPELKEKYRREIKSVTADFYVGIRRNKPITLKVSCEGITVCVEGEAPQEAINRPAELPYIEKQLSKLGDTPYELGSVTADIDSGLSVSASQLNALRREAVEKLDKARIAAKRRGYVFNPQKIVADEMVKSFLPPEKRVYLRRFSQLEGLKNSAVGMIILPLGELEKHIERCAEFTAALPRFTADEAALEKRLAALKSAGCKALLCTNIAHILVGKRLGFELHGDFGLNVTNSASALAYKNLGLKDLTFSFEMKLAQISAVKKPLPCGVIVYGRLPLMLAVNCPVKQAVGSCAKCTGGLTDRTGRYFPVRCDGTSTEVLNCDKLVMSDRLREVRADFVRLDFNEESAQEISEVMTDCENGVKTETSGFTRGLYYRGIM